MFLTTTPPLIKLGINSPLTNILLQALKRSYSQSLTFLINAVGRIVFGDDVGNARNNNHRGYTKFFQVPYFRRKENIQEQVKTKYPRHTKSERKSSKDAFRLFNYNKQIGYGNPAIHQDFKNCKCKFGKQILA